MRFLLGVLLLVSLPITALAQDLLRADAPDWVELAEIPEADPALLRASRDGVFYPLVDTQVAWQGETKFSYFRLVTEVIDRAGLERAATVSSDFDPAFETLTLTRLEVHRDGQTMSYRDDLASEIFRRETRLEAGIIDGTLTAHLQVPDLRVGDIVDMAFLHESAPILEGANRAGGSRLEFSVPVGLTRHVAHWPADWPFHLGTLPDRVEHNATAMGTTIRHEWRRAAHLPPPNEEMTPVEADPDAVLRYGAWSDWTPLSRVLSPYYLANYSLPPDWEAKLDTIRTDHDGDIARASAALRLVQDEIRYVGIEVGAGGYFARPPVTVARQGFGDCKDKALLLRVMLNRLEIAAYPALTHIDRGYALTTAQPAVGAFDHMILRIDIDGKSYWADPTGSHEGGTLDIATPPDYGYALALTGSADDGLEAIDVSNAPSWQSQTTESFRFTFAGAFLTVSTEYRGASANSRRYAWATEPHDEIGRGYLDFYSRRYPGIRQVMPITFEDDRASNLIRMKEHYAIPKAALNDNGLSEDFYFAAEDFGNYYPDYQSSPRTTPLTAGMSKKHRHIVEVSGAPINFNPPKDVAIENPAFAYSFKGKAPGEGKLRMEWQFETRARVVPAGEVAGVISDARKIGDSMGFGWNLDPDEEPAAD